MPNYFQAPDPSPTGGDDLPVLQSAINITPDCGTLVFPANAVYHISQPLSIYSRQNLTLRSFTRPALGGPGHRGTEIAYTGTTGALAVVDINYSGNILLEGLCFSCDGAMSPLKGISIDEWPDSSKPAPTTICTHCEVRDCVIIPPTVNPFAGTPFIGIDISEVSKNNCEFNLVKRCRIQGMQKTSGHIGVRMSSSNGKGQVCDDVSVSYASTAFQLVNGSCSFRDCSGTGNTVVDFALDGFGDPVTLDRCWFEQSQLAFRSGTTQNEAVRVRDCRWGSMIGPYVLNCQTGMLEMTGNHFAAASGVSPTLFKPHPQFGYVYANLNTYDKIAMNFEQSYRYVDRRAGDSPLPY